VKHMIAHEQLLQAVEYGNEEGANWWEYFNSLSKAKSVLNGATEYIPSDYEAAQLVSIMEDVDLEGTEFNTVAIYDCCICELKRQLRNK